MTHRVLENFCVPVVQILERGDERAVRTSRAHLGGVQLATLPEKRFDVRTLDRSRRAAMGEEEELRHLCARFQRLHRALLRVEPHKRVHRSPQGRASLRRGAPVPGPLAPDILELRRGYRHAREAILRRGRLETDEYRSPPRYGSPNSSDRRESTHTSSTTARGRNLAPMPSTASPPPWSSPYAKRVEVAPVSNACNGPPPLGGSSASLASGPPSPGDGLGPIGSRRRARRGSRHEDLSTLLDQTREKYAETKRRLKLASASDRTPSPRARGRARSWSPAPGQDVKSTSREDRQRAIIRAMREHADAIVTSVHGDRWGSFP